MHSANFVTTMRVHWTVKYTHDDAQCKFYHNDASPSDSEVHLLLDDVQFKFYHDVSPLDCEVTLYLLHDDVRESSNK